MKAVIWGSCGSLPSPASTATIRKKLVGVLWGAKGMKFESESEIENYLDSLPHSASGTYKANTSCVQILTRSKEVILCDAGTGIRDFALSIGPDAAPATYHIFISHLHWDHIQGFPFFSPAYKPGNRIIFHGFHKKIESAIRSQMEAPCFPVPFEAMLADIEFDIKHEGATFDVDGIHVKTIKQQHPGDSWGYRFEENGKSIIFSTDSEHGPEARDEGYPFVDFFKSADVLIFDGQYTFEEATNDKRNWGHSDHMTAVELAARAKARQLIVFHHEPGYSDELIEEIHEYALRYRNDFNEYAFPDGSQHYPVNLILAYDGLTIDA
ncbi:MAG: MBL fold metallo-hydrolase [Verrucomicrobiota bacterium]